MTPLAAALFGSCPRGEGFCDARASGAVSEAGDAIDVTVVAALFGSCPRGEGFCDALTSGAVSEVAPEHADVHVGALTREAFLRAGTVLVAKISRGVSCLFLAAGVSRLHPFRLRSVRFGLPYPASFLHSYQHRQRSLAFVVAVQIVWQASLMLRNLQHLPQRRATRFASFPSCLR